MKKRAADSGLCSIGHCVVRCRWRCERHGQESVRIAICILGYERIAASVQHLDKDPVAVEAVAQSPARRSLGSTDVNPPRRGSSPGGGTFHGESGPSGR
eukprot:723803-Prymnesium_polylepis.1